MDKATILSTLRRVKPELQQKYGLTEIALFGFYSRDKQTPESDIDLMLDFNPVSFRNFVNCAYTLEEIFPEKKFRWSYGMALNPDTLKQLNLI